MKTLCEEKINESIIDIIYQKFSLIFNDIDDDCLDINLLNEKTKLKARDLLVLFYELENCYNIKIPTENIVNGDFSTISKISKIIFSQLAS